MACGHQRDTNCSYGGTGESSPQDESYLGHNSNINDGGKICPLVCGTKRKSFVVGGSSPTLSPHLQTRGPYTRALSDQVSRKSRRVRTVSFPAGTGLRLSPFPEFFYRL